MYSPILLRQFTPKVRVPWLNEFHFLYQHYERLKNVVEVPDKDLDKTVCTPIIVERRNFEILAPFQAYYNVFWVNLSDPLTKTGPTVLNLLDYIHDTYDTSLNYRKSCTTGVCGLCAINVNGVNCLACTAPVTPGQQMIIKPLTSAIPVNDLVVSLYIFYNTYKESEPWLVRKEVLPEGSKEHLQSPEDRKKLDGLIECTLCGICASSCPSYWWSRKFYYGPPVLMQTYRWLVDSRDQHGKERIKTLAENNQADLCGEFEACRVTCPAGLNPKEGIMKMKKMVTEQRDRLGEWE